MAKTFSAQFDGPSPSVAIKTVSSQFDGPSISGRAATLSPPFDGPSPSIAIKSLSSPFDGPSPSILIPIFSSQFDGQSPQGKLPTFSSPFDGKSPSQPFALSDALAFQSAFARHYREPVSDSLSLNSNFARHREGPLSDHLNFSSTFADVKQKPSNDVLNFSSTFSIKKQVKRPMVDVLTFRDGFTVSTPKSGKSCYDPVDPSLGTRKNFILTYPFVTPTLTVILRNPRFGNVDQVMTNTKFARTRSGQLNPTRGAAWPVIEYLSWEFEALTPQNAADLQTFFQTSAGFEVGILDQENRQWRGVVVTETISIVKVGMDDCTWAASFRFRGKLA